MNHQRAKLASATIGGGALIAMGAFTAGTSMAQDPPEPAPPGPVTTSEVTTGETATETVAPEAPPSESAVPPITTTPTPIPTGEPQ